MLLEQPNIDVGAVMSSCMYGVTYACVTVCLVN